MASTGGSTTTEPKQRAHSTRMWGARDHGTPGCGRRAERTGGGARSQTPHPRARKDISRAPWPGGRARQARLLRDCGLEDVQVRVTRPGEYYDTPLRALAHLVADRILADGLSTHLNSPATTTCQPLMWQTWGTKAGPDAGANYRRTRDVGSRVGVVSRQPLAGGGDCVGGDRGAVHRDRGALEPGESLEYLASQRSRQDEARALRGSGMSDE
jgi:hypothetical protein